MAFALYIYPLWLIKNYDGLIKDLNKYPQNPLINPFVPNVPFLYPLKTSENLTAL